MPVALAPVIAIALLLLAPSAALCDARKVSNRPSVDAAAANETAVALSRSGRWGEALQAADQAVELAPRWAEAYYVRAGIHANLAGPRSDLAHLAEVAPDVDYQAMAQHLRAATRDLRSYLGLVGEGVDGKRVLQAIGQLDARALAAERLAGEQATAKAREEAARRDAQERSRAEAERARAEAEAARRAEEAQRQAAAEQARADAERRRVEEAARRVEESRRAAEAERARVAAARAREELLRAEAPQRADWNRRRDSEWSARKIGWWFTGAGAAALAGAATFGWLGKREDDQILSGRLPTGADVSAASRRGATYNKLAYGAGAAGLALGAVGIVIVTRHRDPGDFPSRVTLVPAPAGLLVMGDLP